MILTAKNRLSLSVLCLLALAGGCRKSPAPLGTLSVDSGRPLATDESLVGPVLTPGYPGAVDVTFQVRADRAVHPISPLIYGINGNTGGATQRWGMLRNGGNRMTAYNWETNASNAGSDYQFQNDAFLTESNEPAKVLLDTIDAARAIGATSVVTISNADYVAGDKLGGGDVRKSGADYLSKRFKRNVAKKPTPFTARPNLDDDVVYQDELIAYLRAQRPDAKLVFSMDNEPDLWAHTHAEIFPQPLTYADLWKRNAAFAKASKAAWPGAEVLGFVSYGYHGYVSLQDAPDGNGRNFIAWYLDQARASDRAGNGRLIDYLDLHWYPEATDGKERITGNSAAPGVALAREQAPRSLYDAKYKEESWIANTVGGPIALIPRLRTLIDEHYPGTKLAFTEWNYGGGNHISGAIAVADVLGIFGREGVGLASYWPLSEDETFAWAAFRAFRNFDGQLASFGDTSIAASSTDVSKATVYASIDSAHPNRTVLVVINKTTKTVKAGITIAHSAVYATAFPFVLGGARAELVAKSPITAVATNTFVYEMPAQSVSVIVPQP